MNRFCAVRVNHAAESVARAIHAVQICAYAQEARLLGVLDFPPLSRTVEDVRTSAESFFAVHIAGQLVGCASVEPDAEYTGMNITSLTVAPAFQRRGIARALLSEVLQRHGAGPLAVQTGAKNAAALHIYERIGFIAVRRWVVGPEVLEVVRLLRLPPGAAKSAAYAV